MNTQHNTRDRSLPALLRATSTLIRTEMAETLAAEGIRRSDLRAMRLLSGGVPPRGPQAVHLMKRGFAAPTDAGLELTAAGQESLDRVTAAIDVVHTRATGTLSTAQLDAAREALEAMYTALGGDEAMHAARSKRHASHSRPHRAHGHHHGRAEWAHAAGARFGHFAKRDAHLQ